MFNDGHAPLVGQGDLPACTVADQVARGQLPRLAPGLYISELTTGREQVVREHLFAIAARLPPNAVITDRSILSGGPVNGVLYLARPGRPRTVELPGCSRRVQQLRQQALDLLPMLGMSAAQADNVFGDPDSQHRLHLPGRSGRIARGELWSAVRVISARRA